VAAARRKPEVSRAWRDRPHLPRTACAVIDSERRRMPTRALPLGCRLASAKVRSDHRLCTDPRMVRGVSLDDHPDRDDLVVRLPSSIRSSIPVRGVETHNDLDDRALPDRLRSLHRHLDRHQVAPVPWGTAQW
jgi:hypothetical protein